MKKIVSWTLALVMMAGLLPLMAAPVTLAAATWADAPEIRQVATGNNCTLAIKTNGTLWAWGWGGNGQLGLGDNDGRATPTQVGTDSDWASMASGGIHTLAVKTNGTLWAWGRNTSGQLGNGTTTASNVTTSTPVQAGTATDWASVTVGSGYSLAIKTNGTLWAWGSNDNGQLGLGDNGSGTHRTSPTQIGMDTDWASVTAGGSHTIAVKTNGTLWAWGNNSNGQLGLGNSGSATNKNTPTQIGNTTDWASVTAGIQYTIAVKVDGSLWAWGQNSVGQLGLGDTDNRNSPEQVGTATGWKSSVAATWINNHTIAIKTDGSLWAWGQNNFGQLGLDDTTSRNEPTQIGTATDWESMATNDSGHTLAIKADGSLWAWGENGSRQLGDGTTTQRNAPVRIWPTDDTPTTPCTDCQKEPCECGNGDTLRSGIDYATVRANESTVIIPGRIGGEIAPGHSINLNTEAIIHADGYTPVAFSVNGGDKWRATKTDTFSEAKFAKLLNKGLTLHISDKPIDKATKKPETGAVIVTFAKINVRPAAPKMAVNYALDADPTGKTPGFWLLVNKTDAKNPTPTAQRGAELQIGLAEVVNGKAGKNVDGERFGQFFPAPNHGIPVLALTGDKPVRTTYFVRTAPKPDGAAFAPASRPARIRVSSELKATSYKPKAKAAKGTNPATETLKLKRGDFIFAGATADIGTTPLNINAATATIAAGQTLHITADKGAVVSIIETPGTMTVWKAATAKRPATAKQTVTR